MVRWRWKERRRVVRGFGMVFGLNMLFGHTSSTKANAIVTVFRG